MVLAGPGLLSCAGLTPPEARGGLWDRFDPVRCATPEALERTPAEAWEALGTWLALTGQALDKPQGPSRAHRALASLVSAGKVRGVVCTTTDGLVRRCGVEKVAELYGAIDKLRCVECRARSAVDSYAGAPPICQACGGRLRPDMVLFGEEISRRPRELAAGWVYGGRSLLALGADLTRPPVHRIPDEMFQEGGTVISVGEVEAGAIARVRGIALTGPMDRVLPRLVEAVLG